MKNGILGILTTLLLVQLVGCGGPAGKAVKQGDALLEIKDYYGATNQYMTALRYESDHKDAKIKLCENSKAGYEQKFMRAEGYEKSSDHESALKNYRELKTFTEHVDNYGCLNFSVANLTQKINEMKAGASEAYYKEAEKLFNAANYSEAITKYKEGLKHNNPYKDSAEKIAESYYRTADEQEKQGEFRNAANSYEKALGSVSAYKDATLRATTIYEALADHYMSKKSYRNAYNDYIAVRKLDPQYKDITEKIAKAEEAAIVKIAFAKFDNKTGKDLAGAALNDLIGDEIQAKLKNKASHFLKFMDREQLQSIFAEQNLGMTGITDDYSTFKQLKGVNYLIFGKLNQVKLSEPKAKSENKQTAGNRSYDCTKVDKKGKTYDSTCYQKITVNYSVVSNSISLTMGGSFKVLGVSSGEQVVASNFSLNKADSVKYATGFSSPLDSSGINDDIKALAGERQELVGEDSLMKGVISELTDDAARQMLAKLDATPALNDPVSIKLKR